MAYKVNLKRKEAVCRHIRKKARPVKSEQNVFKALIITINQISKKALEAFITRFFAKIFIYGFCLAVYFILGETFVIPWFYETLRKIYLKLKDYIF